MEIIIWFFEVISIFPTLQRCGEILKRTSIRLKRTSTEFIFGGKRVALDLQFR